MTVLRSIAAGLLPLAALTSGCAYAPQVESASSSVAASSETEIVALANNVADWQLANLENLESYIRFISRETPNPRGWVKGTFFLGLMDYAEQTGQQRYIDALTAIAEREEWRLGDRLYHADDHLVGQVYFRLHRSGVASANLGPTQQNLDAILADKPNTQMMHPDNHNDPGCAKRWCWADALFMAPATWWDAHETFGKEEYADYAHSEFQVATDLLFDKDVGLYYRDSRFFDRRGADGEKLFWSRGNGWVYGGLVNVLRTMSADDPRRDYYVSLFRQMSDRLVAIQAENGMWRASLLASSETPPETSGTGFFVYGLAWALNEGVLEGEQYSAAVDAGWKALVANVDDEGRLGYVQQVGDRPEGVQPDDRQLYGVGAFLLATGQILKLEQD
ncbi:glycoside hydrolase family 88/105 protein [Altererythrobacter ishigakiensis]|uniref:Rhamnogalacturonyl hydrolase YesR n=1 Tax=Altererythrobacter ishigakiensis TaxID=476157 RepID=A0A562UM22_9SPHN|nr:glycoside hydrolase family 88 protein [Altererythrobacter ishigakiensis]TWJ06664.1 rhamnogalacturonyl hydrolase YesR [Altererythrobacter ishigakiensis]